MSATGDALPRRVDAGFTLFELLVAVAIMSLAAGLAFPALERVNTRRTLDHAARALTIAIASARADALTRGHAVTLAPGDGAPDILLANGKAVARLPVGASISWAAERPVFFPDGSARGGLLQITADGATRQIDPIARP